MIEDMISREAYANAIYLVLMDIPEEQQIKFMIDRIYDMMYSMNAACEMIVKDTEGGYVH